VSKDDARRSLTGTLVAVEIQIAPVELSSYHSTRKSLPWKESESTWFPSCLPSWLREGEKKTLSKKVKEYKMVISAR
jgi:hypothetical protein